MVEEGKRNRPFSRGKRRRPLLGEKRAEDSMFIRKGAEWRALVSSLVRVPNEKLSRRGILDGRMVVKMAEWL